MIIGFFPPQFSGHFFYWKNFPEVIDFLKIVVS